MATWHRRAWQLVRAHPARAWFLVLALATVPMFYLAVPARRVDPPLPACPVTMAKCELVKIGMSREEVRAILGVPPEDYTGRWRTKRNPHGSYASFPFGFEGPVMEIWLGFDCCLTVIYDGKSGSVKKIELCDNEVLPEPSRMKQALKDVRDYVEEWYENVSCWLFKGSR
jgi:hypothetical protein